MANYIFDPDDYTVGTSLKTLGWTQRWRTASSSWTVVADERASGSTRTLLSRNVIKFVADGATTGRRALSWDAIDSDADRANTEILLVGLKPDINTTTGNIRTMIRGSGADGAEDGYAHGLVVASSTSMAVRYGEYNAGAAGDMTTSSSTSGDNRDIWIALRVRINGTQHWTKRWIPADPLDPEADEPGAWTQGPATDSSVSGAGWVGLFHFDAAPVLILKFAAATNGDTATFTEAAPDTTAPTLTTPTGTATGSASASGTVSTNEGNGTLYYLASTNASESATTVKAASSQAVSATGSQSVSFTGLTASTTYYAHYLHRDAAGNDSTVASSASFTTSAPSGDTTPPTLTGTITISALTTTSYTASWPAGSDNVAVTGYEYRIAGGAWVDRGNNLSVNITGRTPGATETFEVRAYDAAGYRSTPALSTSVTLNSATATVTVTEPLKNNTGTLLASQSGIAASVLSASTLASVHTATGLTTNASGVLAAISNASITTGQQYHVAIKLADGGVGITGPITAS